LVTFPQWEWCNAWCLLQNRYNLKLYLTLTCTSTWSGLSFVWSLGLFLYALLWYKEKKETSTDFYKNDHNFLLPATSLPSIFSSIPLYMSPSSSKTSQFLTMVLDGFWKVVKLDKRSKIIQSRPANIIAATANRLHVKTTQDIPEFSSCCFLTSWLFQQKQDNCGSVCVSYGPLTIRM
jgi:hypothetical protein